MSSEVWPRSRAPLVFADRRRSPRIDVHDQIRGVEAVSRARIRLLDISFGGCLLESESPFEIGSLQQFELHTPDGSVSLTLTVRTVHSRRDSIEAPRSRYVSGFTFVAPRGREAQERLHQLLDAVTSALSHE